MTGRRRLAALGVLIILLAACGGPSPTSSPVPTPAPTPTPTPLVTPSPTPIASAGVSDEIRRLVEATAQLGSARIEFGVGFEGSSQAPDGDAITGSGEFASATPFRAHLTMEGETAGVERMEIIVDDVLFYLRGAAFDSWAPNGEWILIDSTSDHPNAVALSGAIADQSDPWSALYILYGTVGPTVTLERSIIGGVPVRHLKLTIDLDLVADRAPASARDYLLVQIAELKAQAVSPEFQAELWVDSDEHIRRAQYDLPLAPLRGGGEMALWYQFGDFGVEIELPELDPDDIVNIEDVDLG